ncbi:MAG: bifunctional pyr operon transcriptional regulator/uracil phosphoribosyltransferase PyrR [Candidatus Anoxymicrobium japonicum]|uniref:Bifunctional protein PyrR n=1 Tax=Candidatus Anoxymicrobium japonicum TaxID=2013648 RepID=A0A2N3G7K4_9ACTN|nr:MAG: bifunctional pyr operon transcriptional regulator/uracil phosphoribosyltransferase PyrR [Candidatus Anoxymicrobium japonicum]
MSFEARTKVIDAEDVARVVTRISHEILERNRGVEDIVLVGIRTRGVFLARRLATVIERIEGCAIEVGELDVSFYRDDIASRGGAANVGVTRIDFDINDKRVVIVDDVLYTGRTIRAAMDALMDFGRPRVIQLAVLVDRGHRELPVRADYVGKNLPTSGNERVKVSLEEIDGTDMVEIGEEA